MKNFWQVENRLDQVLVKHPGLQAHRTSVIGTVLQSHTRDELAFLVLRTDKDQKRMRDRINANFRTDPVCPGLHFCVSLEHALKLREGAVFGALYEGELGVYEILKREYKLLWNPPVLKRDEPFESIPENVSPEEERAKVRLEALHDAMRAKRFTGGSVICHLVYPRSKEDNGQRLKFFSLQKRLSLILRGERELMDKDAMEIHEVLGVAPSVLLGQAPAPKAAAPKKETEPEVSRPMETQTQTSRNGMGRVGLGLPTVSTSPSLLELRVAIPELGIDRTIPLGSLDLAARMFRGEDAEVRLRRHGANFLVEVQASLPIPAESLGVILDLLLPKEEVVS